MGLQGITALVVAVVPLIALGLTHRAGRLRRDDIRASLEILALLPDQSAARPELQAAIEERIRELLEHESETRDLRLVASGLYLVVVGGLFLLAQYPLWWTWPIWSLAVAFGLFAMWEGWPKVRRDASGLQIRHLGTYRTLRRRQDPEAPEA